MLRNQQMSTKIFKIYQSNENTSVSGKSNWIMAARRHVHKELRCIALWRHSWRHHQSVHSNLTSRLWLINERSVTMTWRRFSHVPSARMHQEFFRQRRRNREIVYLLLKHKQALSKFIVLTLERGKTVNPKMESMSKLSSHYNIETSRDHPLNSVQVIELEYDSNVFCPNGSHRSDSNHRNG